MNPPPHDFPEYKRILNGQLEFYDRLAPQLRNLNDQGRQYVYLKDGIEWSINNSAKLITLTCEYFYLFLMPGVSFHHHPFSAWLVMFVASAPIFALAYFEIIRRIVGDYKKHLAVISVFLGMLVFSLVFFPQARFRVVTIEQFYLMYAASGLVFILDYFKNKLDLVPSDELARGGWAAASRRCGKAMPPEKVFVDFAGDTIDVVDPSTGEVRRDRPESRSARRPRTRQCFRLNWPAMTSIRPAREQQRPASGFHDETKLSRR